MNFRNNPSFNVIKSIGTGRQANVYVCNNLIKHELFSLKVYTDRSLQKELLAYNKLKNCINIAEVIEDNIAEKLSNCLLLRYYQNGDLFSFMEVDGLINESLCKTIIKEILIGLQAVHSKGIIHRDLKPENIFLDEEFNVFIGDFGLSEYIDQTNAENAFLQKFNFCGSLDYVAPEVFLMTSFDGRKADIWSVGCILFLMLTGLCPFGESGAIPNDWFLVQIKENRWNCFWKAHERFMQSQLNDEVKSFIQRILSPNANDRLSIAELLSNPWLNDDLLSKKEKISSFQNLKDRMNS